MGGSLGKVHCATVGRGWFARKSSLCVFETAGASSMEVVLAAAKAGRVAACRFPCSRIWSLRVHCRSCGRAGFIRTPGCPPTFHTLLYMNKTGSEETFQ